MDFHRKALPVQPYLYVNCDCPMDGSAIAQAMGAGFGQVMGFAGRHGITPASMPMSVYHAMPEDGVMRFQCGVMVSQADAAKAQGDVHAGTLPAGEAMMTTHVGPYASLNQTHRALWDHMRSEGIAAAMPVWEVYVDDPGTTPEDTLRTEIYRAIA